jgi:hypothetical protein
MTDVGCPSGWVIMPQGKVTEAISNRAVALLHQWRGDPTAVVGQTHSEEWTGIFFCDYRFEMHPPDFQNPVEHTGVTVFYCPKAQSPVPPPGGPPTGGPSPCPPGPSSPSASGSQPTSISGEGASADAPEDDGLILDEG